jgi:hypothetical protein
LITSDAVNVVLIIPDMLGALKTKSLEAEVTPSVKAGLSLGCYHSVVVAAIVVCYRCAMLVWLRCLDWAEAALQPSQGTNAGAAEDATLVIFATRTHAHIAYAGVECKHTTRSSSISSSDTVNVGAGCRCPQCAAWHSFCASY